MKSSDLIAKTISSVIGFGSWEQQGLILTHLILKAHSYSISPPILDSIYFSELNATAFMFLLHTYMKVYTLHSGK